VCSCDDCGNCGYQTILECELSAGHYVVVVEGYSSRSGNIQLAVSCTALATNTVAGDALYCGGSYTGSNRGAANVVGNRAGDVLYDLHLASGQEVTFDSCGSNFDTYVRVYEGSIGGHQVCSCDDCGNCGYQTILECELSAGHYVVVVEGYSSNEGDIELSVTCSGGSSPPAAVVDIPGCNGLDMSDTAMAEMANRSPTCEAVIGMQGASCALGNQMSFGSARTLIMGGTLHGGALCNIISDFLRIGVLLDDQACNDIQQYIIDPIMNGEFITHEHIGNLVQSQFEAIIPRLLDTVSSGVDMFSSLINSINACPVVNVHPAFWEGKVLAIVEMFQSLGWIAQEAPNILAGMRDGTINDCSVFSAVFTIDLTVFSLLGLQQGIYVTWDFSGVRETEVGMVDGIGASMDIGSPSIPEVGAAIGASVALVIGNKDVWGGWGYTLDIGGSFPTPYGFAVGVGFGLVFGADADNQNLGSFLGFTVSVELSVGSDSMAPDFGASLSCGYVSAGEVNDQLNVGACASNIDESLLRLHNSFDNAVSVLETKVEELEKCFELYLCQAEQCVYGFTPDAWGDCVDAAGQCRPDNGIQQCAEGFTQFTCETRTVVQQQDTCGEYACHEVCEQVTWWCPWGLCDFVCNTVCDGACIAWNYIAVPVINTVTENVPCVGGAIETATSCLQWIGDCASAAGCFISQGIESVHACTHGFILPSDECMESTGFV